ncbi:MAG: PKD domain-containing protein [Patescibacteria group bacterium]
MTRRYLPPALLLTLLLGVTWHMTSAQEILSQQEEELTMEAGTVFEILAVTGKSTTQVSWVLTENRDFVEASRTPLFRIRLTKPGNYSLDAGTFDPDTGESVRKPIRLKVVPPQSAAAAEPTAPDPTGPLVESVPPLDKNVILLTTDILKMTGRFPGQPLALDLDAETDGNGDGDHTNDQETARTFFESDGTTLHMWFSAAKKKRIIALNAPGRATEQITVLERGTVLRPVLQATPGGNGTARFSVQWGENAPTGPLLHHWYFGDGAESLLENPEHSYARNDTYVVRLQIRNLESGEITTEAETSVEIRNAGTVTPDPHPETPAEEEPTEPAGENGTLWTILTYLMGLLIAVAIGLGIVYLIARFRRGGGLGLQKKLEQIESSIVRKDAPIKSVTDIAPPMELKRSERQDSTEEKMPAPPKLAEKPPAPPPPPPETPAWLKKGLEKSGDTEKKTPTLPPPPPASTAPKTPALPPLAPIPTPASPKPILAPPAAKPPEPAAASKSSIPTEQPKPPSPPPAVLPQEPPKPPVPPAPKKPEPASPSSPPKPPASPSPPAPPSPAPSGTASASASAKVTLPKPVQVPEPLQPLSKPAELKPGAKPDHKDDDEMIAFVRADGLNPKPPQE